MREPHEIQTLAEIVDEEMARSTARSHELAKLLVERVAFALVQRIQRDREAVLNALTEEHKKFVMECRTGIRPRYSFIPTVQEVFAKRLWDSWSEESKKLPDGCGVHIDVMEGYCFLGHAQWFLVSGDPEVVMEPYWAYLIDPLPTDILVFDDSGKARPAGLLVIAPQSPRQKDYAGTTEEIARQQEANDQVE